MAMNQISGAVVDDADLEEQRELAAASEQYGLEPATSEEQDNYDSVVMAGMKVMYENDATRKQVIDRLKADKAHPAKTLADTAVMIMIQLDQQAGGSIPEEVIIPATAEILMQLADLADSLDLFPLDDAVINYAMQEVITSLADEYGVDEQDVRDMVASMSPEQLVEIEAQQSNFARKQPPVPTEEASRVAPGETP